MNGRRDYCFAWGCWERDATRNMGKGCCWNVVGTSPQARALVGCRYPTLQPPLTPTLHPLPTALTPVRRSDSRYPCPYPLLVAHRFPTIFSWKPLFWVFVEPLKKKLQKKLITPTPIPRP